MHACIIHVYTCHIYAPVACGIPVVKERRHFVGRRSFRRFAAAAALTSLSAVSTSHTQTTHSLTRTRTHTHTTHTKHMHTCTYKLITNASIDGIHMQAFERMYTHIYGKADKGKGQGGRGRVQGGGGRDERKGGGGDGRGEREQRRDRGRAWERLLV